MCRGGALFSVCLILFALELHAVVCGSGLDSARHTGMQKSRLEKPSLIVVVCFIFFLTAFVVEPVNQFISHRTLNAPLNLYL